jgi:hypothetical protein
MRGRSAVHHLGGTTRAKAIPGAKRVSSVDDGPDKETLAIDAVSAAPIQNDYKP